MKKLAVLIPFYNQERYVDQTLGSVLSQQTECDFEVLVGDDGSTDQTWEKICAWQKLYPQIIRCFLQDRDPAKVYDPYARVSAHKAFLIQQTDSEYFCFLDGDDYYTSTDKIQRQIEILDRPENQDCVGCAHNVFLRFEPSGRESLQIPTQFEEHKITAQMYLLTWYFHSSAFVFRNIFPRPLSVEPKLKEYFDDSIITAWLLQFGNVYYLSEPMSVYRILEKSCSHSYAIEEQQLQSIAFLDIATKVVPRYSWIFAVRHYAQATVYSQLNGLPEELRVRFGELARSSGFDRVLAALSYQNSSSIKKLLYSMKIGVIRGVAFCILGVFKSVKHWRHI